VETSSNVEDEVDTTEVDQIAKELFEKGSQKVREIIYSTYDQYALIIPSEEKTLDKKIYEKRNALYLNIEAEFANIFTDKAPFFMALEHNRYSPVLLVPPMHLNSQFVESLFLRSKQRVGIAYAGMAPPVFPQTSPCLFWSEDTHCSLATQLYERPLPPQIPFMQI